MELVEHITSLIQQKKDATMWTCGKDWVHYSGPFFDEKEYIAAIQCLLGGWLVLGKMGNEFEKKTAPLFGKSFGILTNSGSSANLLMMETLKSKNSFNFKVGEKVITPIAGFPTTVNPIFQTGFVPDFVDIELDTLNLNLDQVTNKAQRGARIITFAHVLGNPPNMDKLLEIIKDYNLVLLEDCCDALGSTYREKPLGSFGLMASCSFYPAHHITLGEGGIVVCDDSNLQKITRSLRDWGRGCYCLGERASMSKCGSCGKRFSNWIDSMPDVVFDHKYVYDEIGYNLKPIELQAAIGLEQLKKLPEIIRVRKQNHAWLSKAFKQYEEFFYLPRATDHSDPSWFAFAITIRNDAPFTRNDMVSFFEDRKIQTRPYFAGNIMAQPAYKGFMNPSDLQKFPVANQVMRNTFFLGVSPVITPLQISYVEAVLHEFITSHI